MPRNHFIIGSVLPRSPSDSLHPSRAQSFLRQVVTIADVDPSRDFSTYLSLIYDQGRVSSKEYHSTLDDWVCPYELYIPHPNYRAQCPPIRVEPFLEDTIPSWHD